MRKITLVISAEHRYGAWNGDLTLGGIHITSVRFNDHIDTKAKALDAMARVVAERFRDVLSDWGQWP